MKYLRIENHTSETMYFVHCTQSSCRCGVCKEWADTEVTSYADRYDGTYGLIQVGALGQRIGRFCSRWDCLGTCIFGYVPDKVYLSRMFDYDESTSYKIGNGKATIDFRHGNNISAAGMEQVESAGEVGWEVGQLAAEAADSECAIL